MTLLSTKKIVEEEDSSDPNSITDLTLNHRALSDVSCLGEFKNLEKLDLGFNNLTSLEGLKLCANLKWLSVVQNKLQSLKGVECLTKLTVLNAGKNKLRSMDEVQPLANLRALILNDNEITSVCKLDQLKELKALVLSRNPITTLGESLVNLKSVTKLSLSNCQLQTVESSFKSCLELRELRLAHNEIMTIPSEFTHLVKLHNLDMGNNLITKWSSLKVLSSLVHLRNLNLQGNPVVEIDNMLRKVKKLLPNLHIFNARLIDKISGKEVHEKANDISVETDFDSGKKRTKEGRAEKGEEYAENTKISEKQTKKKSKLASNYIRTGNPMLEGTKKSKHQKDKTSRPAKKTKTIDSSESPFIDLFVNSSPETNQDNDLASGLVVNPIKKKTKTRVVIDPTALELSRVDEIGLGGPSAWG